MINLESDCFGCDWYTCSGCPYNGKSPHCYCDNCKDEITDEVAFRQIGGCECFCEDCAEKLGAFDDEGDLRENEWEVFNWSDDYEERDQAARDFWDDINFEEQRLERRCV